MNLQWYCTKQGRWYNNKFKNRKQMEKRIQFLKDNNVQFVIKDE